MPFAVDDDDGDLALALGERVAAWVEMGADTLAWFQYGSQRISARLPPQRARGLSGSARLALDIGQVSLFDPTTEQRL